MVVLSTVIPGSAHIVRGRKRAGRLILRCYLALVGASITLLLVAALSRESLLELSVRSDVLATVQYVALGVAVGWCLVIVSAAFIGGTSRLRPAHQCIVVVLVTLLCLVVATPLVRAAHLASAQRGLIGAVFADGAAPDELPDRLNILLLGGDGAADRPGVRTDSVNLASIDTATGRTVMFSLPRNLQDVPFPADSPLHGRFPTGPDCGDECLLNAVHTYGAANPALFPDSRDPGAEAVKQAVSAILGLPVHYYVLVNMDGFRDMVDAFGGITIRVEERVPIGGVTTPIRDYIEPGLQELDGHQSLWYVRSRAESDDYDRMARQRCVIGAILRQADPWVILRRYEKIAASARDLVSTDIPRGLLTDLVDLAVKARDQEVTDIPFVPPLIKTASPDFDLIRGRVSAAIEASDRPPPPSPSSAQPRAAAAAGSGGAGQPADVGSSCRYS